MCYSLVANRREGWNSREGWKIFQILIGISDEYVIKKTLIKGSTVCVYAYKNKR